MNRKEIFRKGYTYIITRRFLDKASGRMRVRVTAYKGIALKGDTPEYSEYRDYANMHSGDAAFSRLIRQMSDNEPKGETVMASFATGDFVRPRLSPGSEAHRITEINVNIVDGKLNGKVFFACPTGSMRASMVTADTTGDNLCPVCASDAPAPKKTPAPKTPAPKKTPATPGKDKAKTITPAPKTPEYKENGTFRPFLALSADNEGVIFSPVKGRGDAHVFTTSNVPVRPGGDVRAYADSDGRLTTVCDKAYKASNLTPGASRKICGACQTFMDSPEHAAQIDRTMSALMEDDDKPKSKEAKTGKKTETPAPKLITAPEKEMPKDGIPLTFGALGTSDKDHYVTPASKTLCAPMLSPDKVKPSEGNGILCGTCAERASGGKYAIPAPGVTEKRREASKASVKAATEKASVKAAAQEVIVSATPKAPVKLDVPSDAERRTAERKAKKSENRASTYHTVERTPAPEKKDAIPADVRAAMERFNAMDVRLSALRKLDTSLTGGMTFNQLRQEIQRTRAKRGKARDAYRIAALKAGMRDPFGN